MRQYVKKIAVWLMVCFGMSINVYAFDCSISKNYAEGKMIVSGECLEDDYFSVIIMSSGVTPQNAWENISDDNKNEYNHIYYSNGNQHSVTASGGYPSDVMFVGNVKADENGKFELEAGIETEGTYDIFVTSKMEGNTKIIEDVTFIDSEIYSDKIDELNDEAKNGDNASFLVVLSGGLNELGFNEIDMAGTQLSDVSEILFGELKANPLNKNDFENNLITYKNCIATVLLNKKQVADITDKIKELAEQDSLYSYYKKHITESTHKKYLTSKMSEKNIATVHELKQAYRDALVLTVVRYPDGYMNIKDILSEIKDEIGISSLSNNGSVYSSIAGKEYNSIAELTKSYKEYVSDLSSSGGGGGGGSSSGGSGGSKNSGNSSSGVLITGKAEEEAQTIKMKFIDLDTVMWAYEAISTLSDKNIISGKSEERFSPNDNINREEFVKLVVCALNEDTASAKESGFSDVDKSAWYNSYVDRGYEIGIINGYENGKFGIGDNITRQDMAVMCYRVAKDANILKKIRQGSGFADEQNISEYARESVSALYEAGGINGVGDNMFDPMGTATRAQAAVMIYNLFVK